MARKKVGKKAIPPELKANAARVRAGKKPSTAPMKGKGKSK
jgi:hypothetical protein